MKRKAGMENYTDFGGTPEVFSFSEKENEKQFLEETFVFKHEDNSLQTGTDLNTVSLGIEDNELGEPSPVKTEKEEQENKDNTKQSENLQNLTTSTSASTASASASSVMSTVAATATAAVVAVVGGGIAMGQTFEKPEICRFEEVSVWENNITFLLAIANSEEELYAEPMEYDEGKNRLSAFADDEPEGEGLFTIELTSPAIPGFVKTYPVNEMGFTEGYFVNLKYGTEYVLNVYQTVMMGASKQYLLDEAYHITTEPGEDSSGETSGGGGSTVGYVTDFYLTPSVVYLTVGGDPEKISAVILPESLAAVAVVEWVNTNPDVIDMEIIDGAQQVLVSPLSEGVATIKAYCDDFFYECEVSVSSAGVPIELLYMDDEGPISIHVGESTYLHYAYYPEDATEVNVVWSSSDEDVVTVDQEGKITSVGPGEATITVATVDGSLSAECIINVEIAEPTFSSVFFNTYTSYNGNVVPVITLNYDDPSNVWGGEFGIRFTYGPNFDDDELGSFSLQKAGEVMDAFNWNGRYIPIDWSDDYAGMLYEPRETYYYHIIAAMASPSADSVLFSGTFFGFDAQTDAIEGSVVFDLHSDNDVNYFAFRLDSTTYLNSFDSIDVKIEYPTAEGSVGEEIYNSITLGQSVVTDIAVDEQIVNYCIVTTYGNKNGETVTIFSEPISVFGN